MNFKHALTLAFLTLAPGMAWACPDPGLWGEDLYTTELEMSAGIVLPVIAGGTEGLGSCTSERAEIGYVPEAPHFTFYFEPTRTEWLTFETRAACDAVLLVLTGNGNYFFDDDDGPGSDARVRLTRPSTGWYDVWIGTFDAEPCWGDLMIQTTSDLRIGRNEEPHW